MPVPDHLPSLAEVSRFSNGDFAMPTQRTAGERACAHPPLRNASSPATSPHSTYPIRSRTRAKTCPIPARSGNHTHRDRRTSRPCLNTLASCLTRGGQAVEPCWGWRRSGWSGASGPTRDQSSLPWKRDRQSICCRSASLSRAEAIRMRASIGNRVGRRLRIFERSIAGSGSFFRCEASSET